MGGTILQLGDGFAKFHPELATQVKDLQKLLKKWGYDVSETGHFDWTTDGAVIHFQRAKGYGADGKVLVGGGKTWPALEGTPPTTLPGSSFSTVGLDLLPFIDQFDPVHVKGNGQTGCFAACETMLRAVGVKQAGPANKFQIITKETWTNDVPTHTIDGSALKGGLAYLDAQLARGIPVMAGVSYEDGKHNEGITEHFVVIYEKEDDNTYRFHDPATTSKSMGAGRKLTVERAKDKTATRITAEGISGQEGYAVGAKYYVTVIRKNEE